MVFSIRKVNKNDRLDAIQGLRCGQWFSQCSWLIGPIRGLMTQEDDVWRFAICLPPKSKGKTWLSNPLGPFRTMHGPYPHLSLARTKTNRETMSEKGGVVLSPISPIVTAQDRKRQILERRRKGLVRSHSLPLKRPRLSDENSSLFRRGDAVVRRRRFDDITNHTNSSSSSSKYSSSRSRLFDSKLPSARVASRNDDGQSRQSSASKIELFPKDRTTSATSGKAASSSLFGAVMERTAALTPVKTKKRPPAATTIVSDESWQGSSSNQTPLANKTRASSMKSPSGFSLLQVLDTVTSPFRGKTPQKGTSTPQKTPQKSPLPAWREIDLQSNSNNAIVDWTMYKRIRMECHPVSCLPGCLRGHSSRQPSSKQWRDALTYFRHPYPLPQCLRQQETEARAASQAPPQASSKQRAQRLFQAVRSRQPQLFNVGVKATVSWREERLREWQESFRSLFFSWIEKLQSETGTSSPYFYLVSSVGGQQQTILFRAATNGCTTTTNNKPMVVLSSSNTSASFRMKLREAGVVLYCLDDNRVFCEQDFSPREVASLAKQECFSPTSEAMVKNDMEALRQAQVFGETAGADVSVRKHARKAAKRPIPSLYLTGYDDCMACFETLLNTVWTIDEGNDVPTLLSRRSFEGGTQSSIRVSQRREDDQEHGILELQGPFLPCILRSVLQAAAALVVEKEKSTSKEGSHCFVVHPLENDDDAIMNGALSDGCEYGESVETYVWDLSQPQSLAVKRQTMLI